MLVLLIICCRRGSVRAALLAASAVGMRAVGFILCMAEAAMVADDGESVSLFVASSRHGNGNGTARRPFQFLVF